MLATCLLRLRGAQERKLLFLIVSVALMLPIKAQPSDAKDLEMLARVLIPAYMAQQFAAVCIVEDPSFLENTASGGRHVHVYAKHVRDEVEAFLRPEEAEVVLRAAADTARAVTFQELKSLNSEEAVPQNRRLQHWCENSAKPFAREINISHFEKHDQVELILKEAKRDR